MGNDENACEIKGVIKDQILLAHNMQYIEGNIKLSDGDEIALIPPVSGG